MYAIVIRETTRSSLKMYNVVYEEKERAEVMREALVRGGAANAWLVFFDDPRYDK